MDYFLEEFFTSESVLLHVAQVPPRLQCLQYLQFVQELQYESLPLHLPAWCFLVLAKDDKHKPAKSKAINIFTLNSLLCIDSILLWFFHKCKEFLALNIRMQLWKMSQERDNKELI